MVAPSREVGWKSGSDDTWTHQCQFQQHCLLNSCLPMLPLFSCGLAFKAERVYSNQAPNINRVKKNVHLTQTLPMKCLFFSKMDAVLERTTPSRVVPWRETFTDMTHRINWKALEIVYQEGISKNPLKMRAYFTPSSSRSITIPAKVSILRNSSTERGRWGSMWGQGVCSHHEHQFLGLVSLKTHRENQDVQPYFLGSLFVKVLILSKAFAS